MKKLVEKLRKVAEVVAREKPKLKFFGLLHPQIFDQWDLVLSSAKLASDVNRFRYMVSRLRKELTKKEMLKISQIVILPPSDPLIRRLADDELGQADFGSLNSADGSEQAIVVWPPRKSVAFARVT